MIFPIYRSDENGLTKKILIDSKGLSLTARIMIKATKTAAYMATAVLMI